MPTNGELVPACGTIELVGLRGRKPTVRRSHHNAGWCSANVPCSGPRGPRPPRKGCSTSCSTASHVRCSSSRPGRQASHGTAGGHAIPRGRADGNALGAGRPPAARSHRGRGQDREARRAAMVHVRLAAKNRHGGRRMCVRRSSRAGPRVRGVHADRRKPGSGKGRCVVVEGTGEQVFTIPPPAWRAQRPRLAATRRTRDARRRPFRRAARRRPQRGRGVRSGRRRSGREGHARLVATGVTGPRSGRKPLPRTGGALPVWNASALTFWWPGRFRQADGIDLFVDTRRGLMHSDVGQLLDGTTRKRSGPTRRPTARRGSAGARAESAGGRQPRCRPARRVVNLYPVCYWVAEGEPGRSRRAKTWLRRGNCPPGQPMASRRLRFQGRRATGDPARFTVPACPARPVRQTALAWPGTNRLSGPPAKATPARPPAASMPS